MGQSSIHSLNKVGCSMFWNSMWDNKITYTRLLKEDIFLESFFLLAFNDNLSINTISTKKKKLKFINKNLYLINKNSFFDFKYLLSKNKFESFSTKTWILKYQNWVILYTYIYITNKSRLSNKNLEQDLKYRNNFFYAYKYYFRNNLNLKYNYDFFKKGNKTLNF